MDVRSRRMHDLLSHKVSICPINSSTLLDSICWSISEPTSTASIYVQHSMNGIGDHSSVVYDAQGELKDLHDSFNHLFRPLTGREEDVLLKNHFLTILCLLNRFGELGPILFPLDPFGELGPSSNTFQLQGLYLRRSFGSYLQILPGRHASRGSSDGHSY